MATDAPEIMVVTDDTTKAEIEQAICHLNDTLRRMPQHWTDRRAVLHARIDMLLNERAMAPE